MLFRALRIALRLITLVLALSAVVFILTGGFWYMWRSAQGNAPQVRITITADKIERSVLGLYLRYRAEELARPAEPQNDRLTSFVVEPGESVTGVAYNLEAQGLITDPELFRRLVQYHQADGDIQVGVYDLRPNMTMDEIMGELRHGRLPTVVVTLPEGWRMEQVAERLETEGVVAASEFIAVAQSPRSDYAFLRDRPAGAPATLEGFLFPDTYQLPRHTSADKVVEIMLRNFDQRVPEDVRAKAEGQKLSFYELIVLASIVERE
ncbi:MAG: endolytic transglycosylase MltG, partial [Chloroflexota bacterium]